MTTILCTLYNSLYLDKGLVLYDSLCECAKDFKLYVLCMDEKCHEVLTDLNLEHHIPVRLSDFEAEDEALLTAKANRPMGEYCWTCSSSFIKFVLEHYGEESCTYIDADMYFYNDPKVLIDEMRKAGKSVMVVPHRFPKNQENIATITGQYCVEFNTFLNIPESLKVLEYWRNRCLETVKRCDDGVHYGDQKYLEELVDNFDCVHVCEHLGAGIAPWNIYSYRSTSNNKEELFYIPDKKVTQIVFYHFQSIAYIFNNVVDVSLFKSVDMKIVDILYFPYLKELNKKKKTLFSEYRLDILIHGHPARHSCFAWLKENKFGQFLLYIKRIIDGRVIVKL